MNNLLYEKNRKAAFVLLVICIILIFSYIMPLSAQEEEGEIIIISERVGKEIDQEERDKFELFKEIKGFVPDHETSKGFQSTFYIKLLDNTVHLFPDINGFQSAFFIKLPDNTYLLKITYLVERTGELKIKPIQLSEESINKYRYHIDHFVRKEDIKEKDFYITSYLGLSTIIGTIGIEFQYKHFSFYMGDYMDKMDKEIIHFLTCGFRSYSNSTKSSWFIGLGGGIRINNPNWENIPLCNDEERPDNQPCYAGHIADYYFGLIFGYRWRWWNALNLSLGAGPNKIKWKEKWEVHGVEVGGEGKGLWMLELAIGYTF